MIQFTEKEFNLIFENTLQNLELQIGRTTNWFPDNVADQKVIDIANTQVNSCVREMHRKFHYEVVILKNKLTE